MRASLTACVLCFSAAALVSCGRASAPARGVTADRILIGVEADTASFSSDEENLGMHLVIADVNARGGIHGRRLAARGYARKAARPSTSRSRTRAA